MYVWFLILMISLNPFESSQGDNANLHSNE